MRFQVNGSRVECHRFQTRNKYSLVASFDAHLEEVAPHVAGALTSFEVQELEQWMLERKRNASMTGLDKALRRIQSLAQRARATVHRGEIPQRETAEKIKDIADSVRYAVLSEK